jgi:hypothetical protein
MTFDETVARYRRGGLDLEEATRRASVFRQGPRLNETPAGVRQPSAEELEAVGEVRRLQGSRGPASLPPPRSHTTGAFWKLVDSFAEQGLRRGEAIRRAVRARPDLHESWLESRHG